MQLRDGFRRCRKLERIVGRLGNPVARTIQPKDFTEYRSLRLEEGISPNTVNHEHAYLRSLFNELRRLGD